jgi:hypothetical protein
MYPVPAYAIGDCPMASAALKIFGWQGRQLRPARAATEKDSNQAIVIGRWHVGTLSDGEIRSL